MQKGHPKGWPFHLFVVWLFPTLAWGDPTLPSALRRFTSEFGMGSGGTTALQPPDKFERVRQEVGMVFQHFNLFPHLTVLQNCTLAPIWVQKMPKKEAEVLAMHYLERVRIAEHAHKYPGQISG